MFEMRLQAPPRLQPRPISIVTAALMPIFLLPACDRARSTANIDQVPSGAVLQSATAAESMVEPQRYLRRSDLASAIRNAGHSCEVVTAYKQIEKKVTGSAFYKIDCLEYSYRLTIQNGKSRLQRYTAYVARG